jgi:hypothetical protein
MDEKIMSYLSRIVDRDERKEKSKKRDEKL